MTHYEKLYTLRNNRKAVTAHLADFLLFQIYSLTVIRTAYPNWPTFRWYLRQNTPTEIQNLIENSPYLKDKDLQKKLNEYLIHQAIRTLSAYQACDTPLTQNKTVSQNRYKLTSKHGDKALTILQNACRQNQFSDKMAELAVFASHKFLMQDKYYLRWRFPKKAAFNLTVSVREPGESEDSFLFPAIQLTQGCLNRCSHCDSRAEPHLSHMPWPVFRGLYRNLNKYYRHYPQRKVDCYFAAFFADSDMLDYYDPMMRVDSGDVGLWIQEEGGTCQYLTRGVKNEQNKLALAKTLLTKHPFALSFVDTPLENKERNLKQLNDTLDVVESLPERRYDPVVFHLHLKSGSTVAQDVFQGFSVKQKVIRAMGRAKDLPANETDHFPDERFFPKYIFRPDGALVFQSVQDAELKCETDYHIFAYQQGPKISRSRLFLRHHILSHFKS